VTVFEHVGEMEGVATLHEIMIEADTNGVKELTLSYIVFGLARGLAIRQILGVRWAGLLACILATLAVWTASVAHAAPRASNPAFLGIQMDPTSGRGACLIDQATRDSPAEAAGLRGGDLVVAIDRASLSDCNDLLDAITAHVPGDVVQLKIARLGRVLLVPVQLTTRDALLHKAIGKPMVATELVAVDDGTTYDLSALHGHMAIVGLYNPTCIDCGALFGRFLEWSRGQARKGGPPPLVLAVTAGGAAHDLAALQRSLDVPLTTAELSSRRDGAPGSLSLFGRDLVIADRDRLGVIVIDRRGIVQYIGPVAPNSDDTEAVLDELFAAAEQAARRPS